MVGSGPRRLLTGLGQPWAGGPPPRAPVTPPWANSSWQSRVTEEQSRRDEGRGRFPQSWPVVWDEHKATRRSHRGPGSGPLTGFCSGVRGWDSGPPQATRKRPAGRLRASSSSQRLHGDSWGSRPRCRLPLHFRPWRSAARLAVAPSAFFTGPAPLCGPDPSSLR